MSLRHELKVGGLHIGLHIGLTGGIGSGKSTVARMLSERGALLVDTDAISRSLTAPAGAALPAIAQAFGAEMVNEAGELNRAKLRALVFAQTAHRQTLEAILHPLIGAQAEREAARATPDQLVVFDVPLLTANSPWRRRVDRILAVDCLQSTQAARVVQRSGWSMAETQRVIAQQISRQQRRALADAILYNEGLTLKQLAEAVEQLGKNGFFGVNWCHLTVPAV